MTVCIAAKASDGKGLVLAADQMATMPHLTAEAESAHKILAITNKIYLLTAGDEFAAREIHKLTLAQKDTIKTVEDALKATHEAYITVRLLAAENAFLKPRGIKDAQEYLNRHQTLNNNIVALIDQNLTNPQFFSAAYIVAGINPDGEAKIYMLQPPGAYGEIGDFAAIGAGQSHANNSLFARAYSSNQPEHEASYLVFEAKKRSEIAPGVGQKTDMVLLTKEGDVKIYTEEELRTLNTLYGEIVDAEMKLLKNKLAKVGQSKGAKSDKQRPANQ